MMVRLHVGAIAAAVLVMMPVAASSAPKATPAQSKPAAPDAQSDPMESINRGIFAFNQGFDRFVFRPVASGYRYVAPKFVRSSIGNMTNNFFEPISMLNAFLQGDFTQGVTSFWRFLLNTTVGIAGINDVATEAGLAARTEDFGQTLATWGLGSGPYIMLPILGPSNLRDSVGLVGDAVSNPFFHYMQRPDAIAVAAGTAVVYRERVIDPIDDINASSLDPYVSFRSIYTQRRNAQIKNAGGDVLNSTPQVSYPIVD